MQISYELKIDFVISPDRSKRCPEDIRTAKQILEDIRALDMPKGVNLTVDLHDGPNLTGTLSDDLTDPNSDLEPVRNRLELAIHMISLVKGVWYVRPTVVAP